MQQTRQTKLTTLKLIVWRTLRSIGSTRVTPVVAVEEVMMVIGLNVTKGSRPRSDRPTATTPDALRLPGCNVRTSISTINQYTC